MADDVCDLTDLARSMCAHCRELTLDEPAPVIRRRFTAAFPGRCARCDNGFQKGAVIGVDDEGNYYCEGCAPESATKPRGNRECDECGRPIYVIYRPRPAAHWVHRGTHLPACPTGGGTATPGMDREETR